MFVTVRDCCIFCCFFFNDTATTEIYTLSLHDALPIYVVRVLPDRRRDGDVHARRARPTRPPADVERAVQPAVHRSEEHTSELQSRQYLVCRLLLEKKKTKRRYPLHI